MKQRSLNARSESQPGHTLGGVGDVGEESDSCDRHSFLARCLRTGDRLVYVIGGDARSIRAGKTAPLAPKVKEIAERVRWVIAL